MRTIQEDVELVAHCGLYCGACKAYLKEKCDGCHRNPAPWHPPAPAGGGKRFLATMKNEASRVRSKSSVLPATRKEWRNCKCRQ